MSHPFQHPTHASRLQRTLLHLCAVLTLLSLTPGAQADPIDTLARIRQTQTITLGNRESAKPFSYLDEQKQPTGYSMDLCLRVVDRLRKDLKLPNLQVRYVTVSGAERIPKLLAGAIDMECGSTTSTKARQEKVDFSYTIFVAGMKILARADTSIADPQALDAKTVALSKGTTSEKLFQELHDNELPKMKIISFANNTEALQALIKGQATAFPQDDILLSALMNSLPDKDRYALTTQYLSVEPYAIMLRKGDTALLSEIDHTLADLYSSGEINKIYDHWFNTQTLHFPMTQLVREAFTRPAHDTGFAKLLGYSL